MARPVRVALARRLGSDIDGAWWPHTASVAGELPEFIEVLQRPLGEVVDICINWSAEEAVLDLTTIVTGARTLRGAEHRRPRLMVVTGRDNRAKLLVLPHMTSQALGAMVMRCATGRPASLVERDTQLSETADCVMRAAHAESASWSKRMHEEAAAETAAKALRNGEPSGMVQ